MKVSLSLKEDNEPKIAKSDLTNVHFLDKRVK